MKLSELKKQIKELHSLQEENTIINVPSEEGAVKAAKNAPEGTTINVVTKEQFEAFLREEILETLNENEEEEVSDDVNIPVEEPTEEPIEEPIETNMESDAEKLDLIGDELVKIAKIAKQTGQMELANQILNQARFAGKLEAKAEAI